MKKLTISTLKSKSILHLLVFHLVVAIFCVPNVLLADEPRKLEWEDLVPPDWNPNSVFDEFTDEEFLEMSDDQYFVLQEQVREMIEAAPTVDSLDDEVVQIPGYMLALEFDETNIREFLLVPYFGACTHTPPPPANQIIHGKLNITYAMEDMYEPVWITGKLRTVRTKNDLGEAGVAQTLSVETGYSIDVDEVKPYTEDN
ncbi:MAG: DUF3299 domain-containing protein [Gammaproteobacteria bacterium]|nr:DUF3299 domain-containing protein [Gammaproteobacteria bacterium]